jgi:hypothetical protein
MSDMKPDESRDGECKNDQQCKSREGKKRFSEACLKTGAAHVVHVGIDPGSKRTVSLEFSVNAHQ